jgi:exodeoxyribonuclease III
MRLRVLTLNIANPSVARAERQLEWLSGRGEQVLVLTETASGRGTRLLLDRLGAAGWDVRAGALEDGERGVAIATRVRAAPRNGDVLGFLPSRGESVALERIEIVGLYVPSRDDSHQKVERKRRFCEAVSRFLAARATRDAVVIGDLNVLEPIHRPHHGIFRDWEYRLYDEFLVRGFVDAYRLRHPHEMEYSWVDYENRGYRFDHAFVSQSVADVVLRCDYEHTPRENDLSDHSALVIELDWPHVLDELETADALSAQPPSLF